MKTILVDAVETLVIEGRDGGWEIFSQMRELLDTLPNKKIVVTNANEEQGKVYGLDVLPYEVFTLSHNPEKTDPSYFEKLLAYLSVSKDDVIYFEHNPMAVASARQAGIVSYQYDGEKKDLSALREFLMQNV